MPALSQLPAMTPGSLNGDRLVAVCTRAGVTKDYLISLSRLYDPGAEVANVRAYGASGSAAVTTLSAAAGSGAVSVQLTDAASFQIGHGILIAGAGPSGGKYVGLVASKSGNVLGLSPATSTSVNSGAVVKHDDTAAITAAIAKTIGNDAIVDGAPEAGVVFFPPGRYRVSGPLAPGWRTSLIGAGGARYQERGVTSLEWDDITTGNGISLAGNANYSRIQGMQLRGPGIGIAATTCIFTNSASNWKLIDVLIYGWGIGCNYYATQGHHFGVEIINCYSDGLLLRDSQRFTSFASMYSNCGGSNIHLDATGTGCHDIHFYDPEVDEAGGIASIRVDKGSDISFNNMTVFAAKNSWAGGTGNAYGILLGDGTNTPSRVRLNNVRVQPYNLADPPSVLAKCIYLRGAGHSLRDVVTNVMAGHAGNEIQDDSNDSLWDNVRMADGVVRNNRRLPTSSGAVASGQLYSNSGVVTVKP